MGVPGFYSWLTRRYPLIKHMLDRKQIPRIDYLYLDMNGIIYKCVKDDSIIFKSQIMPKELEEIWVEIFNYIDMIVNLLKPEKMLFMGLDGVAPRSKMNNQRARRFKSARDYQQYIENFCGYSDNIDSQENFKNNSISPGTKFMDELNGMLRFFIQKKIQQDEQWKNFSVIFSGSDCPGEGEHKIMEFLRANQAQFDPDDNHCLYGADADLIMLGLTLPMKNVCIIREEFVHSGDKVQIVATRQPKTIQFEIIFLTILRQYFQVQYQPLKADMTRMPFDINRIIKDFVFLFFFIGNDFLPRCMVYNIRKTSIEKLIIAFKNYLLQAEDYVVGKECINMTQLARLTTELAKYEAIFLAEKAEDGEKFLSEKQKFDEEFTAELKMKVAKETEFLLQMKHLYANQDGSERKLFYENKFKVDPSTQTEVFYNILSYYVYGLNFVYQYYFVNLPSWSWYYPHYYAPLLTDLSLYIAYMANNNYKLEPFEIGKPFEPFKQLLCILPKQSAELLPSPFQELLLNHESALRSPVDYYPDEFESDMYASTYEYEAISLIPFLDHTMIDNVYDKAIQEVGQEDMHRNRFGNNELYEFSDLHNEVAIQSPFPHIRSFKCKIAVNGVNLRSEFKWANIINKRMKSQYCRMPSIFMKKIEATYKTNKRDTISFVIKVVEPDTLDVKLGSQVFYGYPLEHSGQVQAIATRKQFKHVPKFDPLNYGQDQKLERQLRAENIKNMSKKSTFDFLLGRLKDHNSNLNLDQIQVIYFMADTQCFVRTLSGTFERSFQESNFKSYEIVPGPFVSETKFYETTKDVIRFNSLEDEFRMNEEVLIIKDKKNLGSLARVMGYNHETNKVKVSITRDLREIKQETLLSIANTDQVFFTLRFAAQLVGLRPDVLLKVIGSINVALPKQKGLPQQIDIGLNFISRKKEKLVPNLARINFDNKENQNIPVQKAFMKLELSMRAVELIVEYKKNYGDVFEFIKQRHERLIQEAKQENKGINWNQRINLKDIFASQEDATVKSLMKVYLWLIKKEQTHMPLSSVYSKQISSKKIRKMQELFQERTKQLENKKKYVEFREFEIDPNFLFSRRLSTLGLMYLDTKPQNHFIGDGIICLKRQHFGQYGVIVGIDDNKYEVLFQKPSFGKTDLKGLCDNLWGGKFKFRDLFNLTQWPKHVRAREYDNKKKTVQLGWIESLEQYFPKFKSNPIRNFKDAQLLKKVISEGLYVYIEQTKAKIKPVQIDPGYTVMDNRHRDYEFKYDKQQASMNEKEIIQVKKTVKYVEKPIQPSEVLQGETKGFEPEVIVNKLNEEDPSNKSEQKVEEKLAQEDKEIAKIEEKVSQIQIAEEEEDATDIIG